MSKPQQPPATLATIDLAALETASGGRRAASGGSSSRYAADDRIMDALKDVTMALKDLSTKQAQPQSNDNSAMMMTMMMSLMNQNNSGCRRK